MKIGREVLSAAVSIAFSASLFAACGQTPTGTGEGDDLPTATESSTPQTPQTQTASTDPQITPGQQVGIPPEQYNAGTTAPTQSSTETTTLSTASTEPTTAQPPVSQAQASAPTAEQAPQIQSSTSAIEATMAALQQSNNFWSSSRSSLAPRRDILSDVTKGFNDALNTASNTIGGLAGAPSCPAVTRTVDLNGITVKIDYGTGCADPLTGKTFSGSVTMVKALAKVTSTFAGLSDGTRTLDGKSEMALSGTSLTLSGNSNLKGPKGLTSTNLNEVFAYSDMGTPSNFLDDRLTGNGTSSIVAPNGLTATTALKNLVYEPVTCPLEPKSGSVDATAGPVKATMPVGDDGSAPWPLWCDGCGSVYVNGLKVGKVCWVGGVSFEPSIPIPGL